MLQPIPYLMFDGNCEEAMRFYEKAVGATLAGVTRFADMPGPGGCPVPADVSHRIANARLTFAGEGLMYGGDCHPAMGPYEGIKGVSIALSFDSVGQAQEAFAALSEGGNVTMPMAPAMWAEMAGMVTDRFGVSWIINGALKPV